MATRKKAATSKGKAKAGAVAHAAPATAGRSGNNTDAAAQNKATTDALVVHDGRQYKPTEVPAGVDASKLPTLTAWLKAQRSK